MPACRRARCVDAASMAAELSVRAAPVTPPIGDGGEFAWLGAGPAAVHHHLTRPLLLALEACDARSVLDLGCGNGWLTAALSRCGFDVTGLDHSSSGIAIARSMHPELAFVHADALGVLPTEMAGRFDAIVAVELIDHVARPRLLLRQAIGLLRPGGTLVLTVPYHGYVKNLGLALSNRFDQRLQTLDDHGRLRFFSRRTLTTLVAECGYADVVFSPLGRVAPIARSMLVSGRRPV